MKVITIGRELDNDVVISGDAKVSRHHVQIVSDRGVYRIVDFGSTNGTFVNDRQISGEIALTPGDRVRIGNTVLPWQNYFNDSRSKTKDGRLWMAVAAAVVLSALVGGYFLFINPHADQTPDKQIVKMVEKGGVRYIPMKINGQELDFVFDTGASSICISTLEAALLYKKGVFSERDIIDFERFLTASGDISVGARIILKTAQIGDKTLYDVEATIIDNPNAKCLLGQTVLSRFGKYTIDNEHNEIIFE